MTSREASEMVRLADAMEQYAVKRDAIGFVPSFSIEGKDQIIRVAKALRRTDAYRDVIDEALVVRHIGVASGDAKADLNKLLDWEVGVALDPTVSEKARDLVEQGKKSTPGYAAGFEACREAAVRIARRDCRTEGAKSVGYVPNFQKRANIIADEIAALPAPAGAAEEVTGWLTMDTAPKDGSAFAVICWWPSYVDGEPGRWSAVEAYSFEQDPQREQCWVDSHRTRCIREDRWIERYRWYPLPTNLPAPPAPITAIRAARAITR